MSEITWEYLSMRQQETLRDIVLGNGAVVFDPAMHILCQQLEGYGLVKTFNDDETGRFEVDPTDKGREVYTQQPAQSTAGERPDTELSHADFMDTLRTVLDFPPSEEFGTWAVIEAIRQDRALLMTYEAQLAQAQAARDAYENRFNDGWFAATRSLMDIFEKALDDAPRGMRLAAIETLIEDFRNGKQASTPAGGE